MKRCIILLLFVILSLTFEETKNKHYLVYINPTFEIQNQLLIKQSVDDWQDALDNYVTFEFVNLKSGNDLIVFSPATTKILNKEYKNLFKDSEMDKRNVIGLCLAKNSIISINLAIDVNSEFEFQQTSSHEVGHALGLNHTKSGTIMCKDSGCISSKITCDDVKQFCKINNCNAGKMRICYGN